MIPISLSLEGFYSYQKQQIIDFTQLTKAGVFGIFGTTGSGKSAIIEAMVYALYGDSERINSREDRAYNMMNLQSNEFKIDFICASEQTKDEYRIIVSAKRTKQFEKVNSPERTCYKKINAEWKPVEVSIIEKEVTGLSYNNFKRTVIIPQGQFMEFLQLTSTERTTMLKELFHLHKYELSENVKNLETTVIHKKTLLEGKLQEIGDVSETIIEDLIEKEKKISIQGTELKAKNLEIQTIILQQTAIIENLAELEKVQTRINEQIIQKPKFQDMESLISKIDFCTKNFTPTLDTINHKQQDFQKVSETITTQTTNLEKENILFNKIQTDYNDISKEFIQISDFEKQTKEISFYADAKKCESAIIIENQKITSAQQRLESIEKTFALNKVNIESKSNEIQNIKNSLENITTIIQEKEELETYLNIQKQIEECRKGRVETDNKIKDITNLISAKASEINIDTSIKQAKLLEHISAQIDIYEQTIEKLDTEIQNHKLQNEIVFLNKNLHSGFPCPVCGAIEHPLAGKSLENAHSFEELETAKKKIQESIKTYNSSKNTIQQMLLDIDREKKIDSEFSKKMHELTIARNLAEPDFEARTIEHFSNRIQAYTLANENITKFEKDIIQLQLESSNQSKEKENATTELQTINQIILELNTRNKTLLEQVSKEVQNSYFQNSNNELLIIIESRNQKQIEIQKKYQEYAILFESKKESIQNLNNSIQNAQNQHKTIYEELDILNTNLQFAISKSQFTSQAEIKQILLQKDNLLTLSQTLEQYKNEVKNTEFLQKELQEKLQGKTCNREEFEQLQKQFTEGEKFLQEIRDEYIRTTEQLKNLKTKFENRKKIASEVEKINHELENLSILKKLFMGNGFVNYMSTRYLKMLCDIANKRFMVLTKHSLKLEVDDNNFRVRDFMNNGKLRHVKTLSGGQAFQAALSLALALSETIHINAPIVSNFFFIDEGFGSQDKESLSIVFDTLRSLQFEGKTVGIISHVEELKENIPVYINVSNTDKGSRINYL